MDQFLRAAYHTLGCKLNFSETSVISRQLKDAGYHTVDFNSPADVYVINTCSVTENADRECRTIVNRALASNQDAFIVVTGCFAQLKPEAIANMPGVDLVLGAREKFNIPFYLSDLKKREQAAVWSCGIDEVFRFQPSYSSGDRTRSFLKVQDGCDYSCTFCTIPRARGVSRSGSIQEVKEQILQLVESGVKEIVLTGINLGDFGKRQAVENSSESFFDLAKAIEELDVQVRMRISSIEPNLLSKEIIELVASSSVFMPHFHIPLQSGSNKVLKRMKRRYQVSLYTERISYIKRVMPHACIGADVIVGFPGETEIDFEETVNFIRDMDISYLHVFTYSERDHTEAVSMPDIVPMATRKARNKRLRMLSEKKLSAFYRSQEGRKEEVLFERPDEHGFIAGYTRNYIRVKSAYVPGMEEACMSVNLDQTDGQGLYIYEPQQLVNA